MAPFDICLVIVSIIQVTLTADENQTGKLRTSGFKKGQQQARYVWKKYTFKMCCRPQYKPEEDVILPNETLHGTVVNGGH